jgi:glycosyltransferase involved in cell wall biosynthesis
MPLPRSDRAGPGNTAATDSPLRVSVVMPSYNHGRFIRAAIDSVLLQDYPCLDLLVMDGGSADGTLDILKSYGDRISFVSQKDRGQSHAINQGFARMGGDILCWLNSDDLLAPHALRHVVRAFEEHPEAGFVYGNGWTIDEEGGILGDSGVLPFDLWKLIHQRNFIQQPSCFIRRPMLDEAGGIDESLHYVMDWEFWIRLGAFKGLHIPEHLSLNRAYGQNKTQSGYFRRWHEIYEVVRRYTDARWPPILSIYLLEIVVLMLRANNVPASFVTPLAKLLDKSMRWEMSGCHPEGGLESRFSFSVWAPGDCRAVALRLAPLSTVDPSRLGRPPVTINWNSSGNRRGTFALKENGEFQEFILPLDPSQWGGLVHFRCKADNVGRGVVGFMQSMKVGGGAGALCLQCHPVLATTAFKHRP